MTPTTIILTTSTTTLQVELQYNYNYNYTRQEIDTQKGDEIKRHKEKVTPRVRERGRERERYSEPQPPFDPSVGSLCHPRITTTHFSCSFLSLLCGTTGNVFEN
jgi:hypothetical protein